MVPGEGFRHQAIRKEGKDTSIIVLYTFKERQLEVTALRSQYSENSRQVRHQTPPLSLLIWLSRQAVHFKEPRCPPTPSRHLQDVLQRLQDTLQDLKLSKLSWASRLYLRLTSSWHSQSISINPYCFAVGLKTLNRRFSSRHLKFMPVDLYPASDAVLGTPGRDQREMLVRKKGVVFASTPLPLLTSDNTVTVYWASKKRPTVYPQSDCGASVRSGHGLMGMVRIAQYFKGQMWRIFEATYAGGLSFCGSSRPYRFSPSSRSPRRLQLRLETIIKLSFSLNLGFIGVANAGTTGAGGDDSVAFVSRAVCAV
ncbi:hypothetical protein B0H16DRAFT_1471232 [Mycena metata]|uniref:Uncharacterized protein n=1 Tax=Mycena metata TaxID=1033252 RepID=A0AAD7HT27_9AGAR|nr:hypothetical protein B0H16DRAFT_1471232 [Mycena metata]